ncbi:MAG: L-glutamine:2-deoxy-scyllo-inosose aminotransferase [Bacteroidetes bacterium ADurb.Bin028]|nr:MAG: L-glutamine:2-deoxy-scyllo-inosose aminotransferase [Bacteroidetes bacterium ADurb.Bin028]HOD88481.1 aminotransferase class I/II-fold pyridoxal phosphate-dependent enzyme [Bacteroidales bacterium]
MADYIKNLKTEISKYLKTDNIYFHYKGRVSLYVILQAMNVKEGDEVIIPAYTCVVVPNPIIYLGAKPVYVDIDKDNLCMDINLLEKNITEKTKVIICQNTYGLSANVDTIVEIAKKHNLYTIEDCTHGFGGFYKNQPNGSYCDAAFYSMQWNKPFSSGIGGFLTINNAELLENINKIDRQKAKPGFLTKLNLKLLFFAKRYFLNNTTYWFLLNFYRWLSKNNLVTGSSSGNEISDIKMPDNFLMDYSQTQAKEGLRNIKKLPKLLALRKNNALKYTEFLLKNNKVFVKKDLFENHSFLKYPILVKNRDKFFDLARKHKIELGDWFNSPIHPVQNNFEKWEMYPEKYPIANYTSQHVVNLPTDTKKIKKVLSFMEKFIDEIL